MSDRKLKPALNKRIMHNHKCCKFCCWFVDEDDPETGGTWYCNRDFDNRIDDGPFTIYQLEESPKLPYVMVCDRYNEVD